MKKHWGNEGGWLLADAVLAMMILAGVLLAIAYAFGQSVKGTAKMNNQTVAAYFAKQQMESLRQYDETDELEEHLLSTVYEDTASKVKYTCLLGKVTEIEKIPAGLDEKIIPVQATVTWQEKDAAFRQLQMVTYYYRR